MAKSDIERFVGFKLWLVFVIPFYIGFAACVTRGFATLAVIEFQRKSAPAA